jgi:hypothetical protein
VRRRHKLDDVLTSRTDLDSLKILQCSALRRGVVVCYRLRGAHKGRAGHIDSAIQV